MNCEGTFGLAETLDLWDRVDQRFEAFLLVK
jgi:hypothetical protein